MSFAERDRRKEDAEVGTFTLSCDEASELLTRALWALVARAGGEIVLDPAELEDNPHQMIVQYPTGGPLRINIRSHFNA